MHFYFKQISGKQIFYSPALFSFKYFFLSFILSKLKCTLCFPQVQLATFYSGAFKEKNKQNKNRNKTLEMCYILMSEIVNGIIINSAQRKIFSSRLKEQRTALITSVDPLEH